MIKITKSDNVTLISAAVTDFTDSLGFCEYKIPLSIKGVKAKPSAALIQGTIAHSEKQAYEEEHAELVPVTAQDIVDKRVDIEFARENIYSKLLVPFEFDSESILVSLSGRIDKIMRSGSTLIIQDDKFTLKPQSYEHKTQPYPSQLLQVLTYLNSTYSTGRSSDPDNWFNLPHSQKMWQIRICDQKTREPYKVFSDYQDAFAQSYLHMSLEKFATISLGITEPTHHNSVAKCNSCNLKSYCDFRLT